MASLASCGSAVALGKLMIGLAPLRGGRWTLLGLSGAIGFHLCPCCSAGSSAGPSRAQAGGLFLQVRTDVMRHAVSSGATA